MQSQLETIEVGQEGTVFVRDVDTRVLQGIVLQVLAKIDGISLIEGNLFDSLLGRDMERVKGIHVEQQQKEKKVDIRVEINIVYGISIPEKSEEIQNKLVKEITHWSGMQVGSIHVVFKELISPGESLEDDSEPSDDESFEPTY